MLYFTSLCSYLLLHYFSLRGPDHEDSPFAPTEGREEIQHLFPRKILLVEQLHSAGSFFARDDLRTGFHPFAKNVATHIAWCDLHTRIISYAFHFSRNANRVHLHLSSFPTKPPHRTPPNPPRALHP